MNHPTSFRSSRRELLELGLRTGVLGLLAKLTRLEQQALALGGPSDYRALVCLYLYGGNDGFNLVVPTDAVGYGTYAASRQSLAVPLASLLPISPANPQGGSWGLHSKLTELVPLFSSGKLAIVGNVGSLVQPTTKAQIASNTAVLPFQLFSHYDQTYQWMTSVAHDSAATGWCGRVAEELAAWHGPGPLPINISLDGVNRMQIGPNSSPYTLGSDGPIELDGFDDVSGAARKAAFQSLLQAGYTNHFHKAYAGVQQEAMAIESSLSAALAAAPPLATVFPNSYLGKQLAMVAKAISIQAALGKQRQIFFVARGGFDTHDAQNQAQPNLFADVSKCLAAFYAALIELGYENSVTTFTASDFGRTLSSNGKGSDHGWGSHHLVLGGAVNGGDLYGTMPSLSLEGPDDVGGGRLIPTTAVDQYAATLGKWLGVPAGDLPLVFPNLSKFAAPTLGFLP
jgi:uncharacterized protein (DUF1501 family)